MSGARRRHGHANPNRRSRLTQYRGVALQIDASVSLLSPYSYAHELLVSHTEPSETESTQPARPSHTMAGSGPSIGLCGCFTGRSRLGPLGIKRKSSDCGRRVLAGFDRLLRRQRSIQPLLVDTAPAAMDAMARSFDDLCAYCWFVHTAMRTRCTEAMGRARARSDLDRRNRWRDREIDGATPSASARHGMVSTHGLGRGSDSPLPTATNVPRRELAAGLRWSSLHRGSPRCVPSVAEPKRRILRISRGLAHLCCRSKRVPLRDAMAGRFRKVADQSDQYLLEVPGDDCVP